MDSYSLILNKFCSIDDMRAWMLTPFAIVDYVYATDAYTMVIMPKKYAPDTLELKDRKPENVLCVIPKEDRSVVITIEQICDAILKVPVEVVYPTLECEACEGSGNVAYLFEYDDNEYERRHECPICSGKGELQDKSKSKVKEYSEYNRIKVGQFVFGAAILENLEFTMKLMNAKDCLLVSQISLRQGSLFKVGDISVLLMPLSIAEADTEIVATI